METIVGLNWLAILVVTGASFALGGLWYGPLFGKAWMDAIGKKPEDLTPSAAPYVISFVTALITAIIMALMIDGLGINSAAGGLHLGLAVGLGLIATAMASDSAFCGWGLKLFLIQAGYRSAYSLLIGVVLAIWS